MLLDHGVYYQGQDQIQTALSVKNEFKISFVIIWSWRFASPSPSPDIFRHSPTFTHLTMRKQSNNF